MNMAMRMYAGWMTGRKMEAAGDDGAAGGGAGGDAGDKGAGGGGNQGGNQGGDEDDDGDGKPPSDEVAKLLRETMQRKQKISELSDEKEQLAQTVQQLQEKMAAFEGIDPKEYQTLKEEAGKRREQELEGAEDWATLKADLEERHQAQLQQVIDQNKSEFETQLAEAKTKAQELQATLEERESFIEELTIGNNFGNSAYIKNTLSPSVPKVRKLYGDHFDFVDGQVHAFNKPRGAEKRDLLVDGSGKPLAFDAALQKIVENDPDKDSILKATQRSGSGSGSDNRDAGGGPVGSGVSRIQASLSKG